MRPMTEVETKKQEVARILGCNPGEINIDRPQWGQLLQEGVVVDLTIRRWRATSRLTLSDLGLVVQETDERQAFKEAFRLGQLLVLPSYYLRKFASIESSARQIPGRFGFQTYWGTFIPATRFQEFQAAIEIKRQAYLELAGEVRSQWNAIVEEVIDNAATNARAAYRRFRLLSPSAMSLNEFRQEDEFIVRYVERVKGLIPDRDEVYASFNFEISLSYIPLPDLLAKERAAAVQYEAEAEKARAEARAAQERAGVEARRAMQAKMAMDIELDHKRYLIEQMNRAVIAEAREKKEKLFDRFLQDLIGQTRQLILDVTEDVTASIAKNGRLHQRSATQLRNLVEAVNGLNFYGDQEIEQLIAPLREVLTTPQSPGVELTTRLEDVKTVARATLLNLGMDSRGRRNAVGMATPDIEPLQVRRARRRLQMDTDNRIQAPVIARQPRGQV